VRKAHVALKINAGHAIVAALRKEGVSWVFGIPGGHVLPIYDGIYLTDGISSVLTRHEHHAAAMAAGWAHLTGEPGVVLVTAGPGVTNTLTAVAEAYIGALPLIILSGRGATATALRGASQEIPTDRIFAPVTKSAVRVDRADLLMSALRQAFATARGGRPGPVLLDLPRDILTQDIDADYAPAGPRQRVVAEPGRVVVVAAALRSAQRPLIIAGGGAQSSDASAAVTELAEALAAPVLTSLSGRGVIGEDHPLAAGGLGAHGTSVSKSLLSQADVILGLGVRFEEMETNWSADAVPPRAAIYIQVDIDPAELGRSVPVTVPVVADIRSFAEQCLASLAGHQPVSPPAALSRDLAELEESVAAMASSAEVPLHPVRVIRAAREVFPRDTVLAVDVGALAQHIAGAFPYFPVFGPRTTIVPSSFYGMGYAAAAIPVARFARPEQHALCFVGDGSFQMVMNVLPMAAQYRLGVTWCVLDDQALGSIWDQQHFLYGDRILDTTFGYQPDLAGIATASGCHAAVVEKPDDIVPALAAARAANERGIPAVLDFRVARVRVAGTRQHAVTVYPDHDER
jgi:acetolactate synthase I/II/III large subunit